MLHVVSFIEHVPFRGELHKINRYHETNVMFKHQKSQINCNYGTFSTLEANCTWCVRSSRRRLKWHRLNWSQCAVRFALTHHSRRCRHLLRAIEETECDFQVLRYFCHLSLSNARHEIARNGEGRKNEMAKTKKKERIEMVVSIHVNIMISAVYAIECSGLWLGVCVQLSHKQLFPPKYTEQGMLITVI